MKRLIFKFFNKVFYPKVDLSLNPISWKKIISMGILQKIIGFNRATPWPVHFTSSVSGYQNIIREKGASLPGYSPNCYIQAASKIYIGSNTRIGPSVKLISQNHNIYDIDKHIDAKPIKIGQNCWISANAVILPEVELGDYTVVGAGSVVTKSFKDGYCVIGGVPAKIIKYLDREKIK
jgi:acetyltransferase-like isoleucine patch superfamily enzyme